MKEDIRIVKSQKRDELNEEEKRNEINKISKENA